MPKEKKIARILKKKGFQVYFIIQKTITSLKLINFNRIFDVDKVVNFGKIPSNI